MGIKINIPANFKNFEKKIQKLAEKNPSAGVEIGVVENATGTNKDTGKEKDITIAEEAFINCKGDPANHVPPRDYQTETVEKYMPQWKEKMPRLLKAKGTEKAALALGLHAKDKTKDMIAHYPGVRNAYVTIHGGTIWRDGKPVYIKGKGKDTPLVHFGDLLNSITYALLDADGNKKL